MSARAKATKETDPAIARCVAAFYAAFVRRYNPPAMAEAWLATTPKTRPFPKEQMVLPMIAGGKDANLFKKMLDAWGETTVLRLIEEFFEASRTDPRIIRANPDVGGFYFNAQYLLTRNQRVTDRRTAENLDAAVRAMRPAAGGR